MFKEKSQDQKQVLLQEALANFDNAESAYSSQRAEAQDDRNFLAGNQYSGPEDANEFRLQCNLLGPFVQQITAEARQANPSIEIIPVSDKNDANKAEVIQGLVRHIEQVSDAEYVYQTALRYAAMSGEGYFMLDSRYISDKSFEQELIIKSIDNPDTVFLDPNCNCITGKDAEWGFVIEDLDHGTFVRKFPESEIAQTIKDSNGSAVTAWDRLRLPSMWLNANTVRVAKYWVKEYEPTVMYQVQDPVTLVISEQDEKPKADQIVLNKKKKFKITVHAYTLSAAEVLEETIWPGQYIPILKVTGDTFWTAGQKAQFGAIRMAKDPQRQYNYAVSKETEMIDMAPKNSFVITSTQMGKNKQQWTNANRVNYGALVYEPDPLNPNPPSRVSALDPGAFNAVLQARNQAFDDMKSIFGLQDASLGRPGNETSAVGIEARVEQSSRSTYIYFDNFLISLKHLGRMIIDVIPTFYDTERTIRIVKPTNEDQIVIINSMKNKMKYDLTSGEYDVVVSTGPAYASKRDQEFERLMKIKQVEPNAPIGDLIAALAGGPMAQHAAARIKATYPIEVTSATDEDEDDLVPAEQVKKLQQVLAQTQNKFQEMELEKKELELKLSNALDKNIFQFKKLESDSEIKNRELDISEREGAQEFELKIKELELKEKDMELKEKELAVKSAVAANNILDSIQDKDDKPVKFTGVSNTDTNISTEIGGDVDK